ncbi:MAG: MlaD family protein [Syntrophales bacterium]|jgi:phospholipid/cholesterol/gamma-HCH transport system substrate-binding protein
MKSQKTTLFITGLFVTIGLLIGAGTIIWLGATNYFQKGKIYVSYFDESVQGLSPDSIVKFRGVEVGRVQRISVAPDNRLIAVVMKVDLGGLNGDNLTAQLKAAGITGIVFVELDQREKGESATFPKFSFESPYTVIPSKPSGTKRFLSDVDVLLEKLKKIDIQSLVNSVQILVNRMGNIASDKRTTQILSNIESTTGHLEKTMARIDRIMGEGKVEDVLQETKDVMAESRSLVQQLHRDLDAFKLTEQGEMTRQWVGDLSERTRSVAQETQLTMENLRQVSGEMQLLMERMQVSPGDVIFSRVPPEDRKGGGQ